MNGDASSHFTFVREVYRRKLLQEILYYHFIPSYLSFYLSTQSLGAFGWVRFFSSLRDFERIAITNCASCNVRYWTIKCPACWQRYWSSGSRMLEQKSKLQPLVDSLDGRLVITVSRTGGRVVRLLLPRAHALP